MATLTAAQAERAAHTYITHLVNARDTAQAEGIAAKILPSVLRVMADLLYVDSEAHGVAWLRRAVVAEARA